MLFLAVSVQAVNVGKAWEHVPYVHSCTFLTMNIISLEMFPLLECFVSSHSMDNYLANSVMIYSFLAPIYVSTT